MRPRRLAGFSVTAADGQSVARCWRLMLDWIVRKGVLRDVELGYGLFEVDTATNAKSYTACIECPDILTVAEIKELDNVAGPAGAFLRRRLTCEIEEIADALKDMRADLTKSEHVVIDRDRPFVSVLIGLKDLHAGRPIRSNLLAPVRSSEFANADNRAA